MGRRLLLRDRNGTCTALPCSGTQKLRLPVSVFLLGIGANFQPSHHEVHEMAPALKIQISRQRAHVIEKRATRPDLGSQQTIRLVCDFKERMQTKGQQVHRSQKRTEVRLAVTEVVLQVIPLGLEHGVAFILDLPARPSCRHEPDHVLLPDFPVRDEGVVIKQLPIFIGARHFQPVDFQCVLSLCQWHVIGPAIVPELPTVGFALNPQLHAVEITPLLKCAHPPSKMGVGSWFAGE
jgi:hypothetical protein